jgi:hypothetical protein
MLFVRIHPQRFYGRICMLKEACYQLSDGTKAPAQLLRFRIYRAPIRRRVVYRSNKDSERENREARMLKKCVRTCTRSSVIHESLTFSRSCHAQHFAVPLMVVSG